MFDSYVVTVKLENSRVLSMPRMMNMSGFWNCQVTWYNERRFVLGQATLISEMELLKTCVGEKNRKFLPAGPFTFVLLTKCLSRCSISPKSPLPFTHFWFCACRTHFDPLAVKNFTRSFFSYQTFKIRYPVTSAIS